MNTSQMTQSMVGSKILVAVVAALTAATGMAVVVSPTKPGFKDISGVTVGSGETATVSDDVIVGEGAEFRKTGAGSLTVPLSRVNRQIGWGMTVSEGKLRLEAGADGTAATPPAAMSGMPTALGRAAETHELVDVILFMCSDNASFITGTNHVIDGGRLCMYKPYVAPKTKEEK